MTKRRIKLQLGTFLDLDKRRKVLELYLDDLPNCNFAVIGVSGSGKSRCLTDVACQLIDQGAAVAVIDPSNQLCADIVAYQVRNVNRTGCADLLKRFHWFQPGSYDVLPRIDWFRFNPTKPIHPEHRDNARRLWTHTQVMTLAELVQLKQGQVDFEQNARLQRVLTEVLEAVASPLDDSGRHLPLGLMWVLLTPDHPAHAPLFERIAPKLKRQTLADLRRLQEYRRVEDRLRESESTLNRTSALLDPASRAIYSDSNGPSVDFRQIIRDRGVQLWSLKPDSEYFTHDAKRTFGQLAIHANLSAMLSMPREVRLPFVMIVDEASELANEELLWALGAMRKTGDPFSLFLGGQDLSSFCKKDLDMRPKVVSQSNLVCFNQQWPEDTDILGRVLFTGDLEFKELVQEVERHGGYDWHRVTEHGMSLQRGRNWGESDASALAHMTGQQHGTAVQNVRSWNEVVGTAQAQADGKTTGNGTTSNVSETSHTSPIIQGTRLVGTVQLGSSGSGTAHTNNETASLVNTLTRSQSSSAGGSEGTTVNEARSAAQTHSSTHTVSAGGNEAVGLTISQKLLPLARTVREQQKTGQLEKATTDQLEKKRQYLAGQGRREAVVKLLGRPGSIAIVTREVKDAFTSAEAQAGAVEWAKREIYASQPYYFVPNFDPAEEERLLEELVREVGVPADLEQAEVANQAATEQSPML